MAQYPKDPFILYSWINMKLRDFYSDLDQLCDDLEIDKKEMESQLEKAGFHYDSKNNRFI